MSQVYPLSFTWDGEAMLPLNARAADRQYVVGEHYKLAPYEERSAATHNHEFAWLQEAWQNLPENLADAYPTPDHLRRRALIEAGYFTEKAVDAGSNAAALRVAAFARSENEFALVMVRGAFVIMRIAKSQSRRAMNKQEFQASKTAIMEVIASLIGATPEALAKAEAA